MYKLYIYEVKIRSTNEPFILGNFNLKKTLKTLAHILFTDHITQGIGNGNGRAMHWPENEMRTLNKEVIFLLLYDPSS